MTKGIDLKGFFPVNRDKLFALIRAYVSHCSKDFSGKDSGPDLLKTTHAAHLGDAFSIISLMGIEDKKGPFTYPRIKKSVDRFCNGENAPLHQLLSQAIRVNPDIYGILIKYFSMKRPKREAVDQALTTLTGISLASLIETSYKIPETPKTLQKKKSSLPIAQAYGVYYIYDKEVGRWLDNKTHSSQYTAVAHVTTLLEGGKSTTSSRPITVASTLNQVIWMAEQIVKNEQRSYADMDELHSQMEFVSKISILHLGETIGEGEVECYIEEKSLTEKIDLSWNMSEDRADPRFIKAIVDNDHTLNRATNLSKRIDFDFDF